MSLLLLPNQHINLGLRPSGLYETVDPQTGVVSFHSTNPGGTPIPQLYTLNDFPVFTSRDRKWLQDLRTERTTLSFSKKKKSTHKDEPNDNQPTSGKTKSAPRKSRKPVELSSAATHQLSSLDPATLAALKALGLGG